MKLFRFRKPAFRQRSPGHLAGTDMLWLLGSLCQLHSIPFDPLLIERQFPPPCSIATIHNALDALGFKTGESALPFDAVGLSKLTLPMAGFIVSCPQIQALQDDPSENASEANLTPILIVSCDGEQLLFFRPGSQAPETASVAKITQQLHPHLLLLSRNETVNAADAETAGLQGPRFGFKWFIPELLKHKAIWKEILLASLMIQLIALATPLHTSGNSNIMQVTMVNAWDAGFFFVHLVEDQSVNVVPATAPDNIGRTLYSQSSFYHVGQHQKNNISPYDAKGCITLGDVDSPTKLLFYLWRKKPQSIEVKPDLVYEMKFNL